MKLRFTGEQSHEMFDILVEIHDALKDKSMNKGGIKKLSQYEIGWLIGIEEFLKKNNVPMINENLKLIF